MRHFQIANAAVTLVSIFLSFFYNFNFTAVTMPCVIAPCIASLACLHQVVAPTIYDPACQEQLVESAKHVSRSVDHVVNTAGPVSRDEQSMNGLRGAADDVTRALEALLRHIRAGANRQPAYAAEEVDTIMTATDQLFSHVGSEEMVNQARLLATATARLVNALKSEAEGTEDSDQQRRLLAAARAVADATARLVEAAKGCAGKPDDQAQREALRQAAEHLRTTTAQATADTSKKQALNQLQLAARNAASAATQCINTATAAQQYNDNKQGQQQLLQQGKLIADETVPLLVQALRQNIRHPDDGMAQSGLIRTSQDMLKPCGHLVTLSKASVPTVTDQACALSLGNSARNLSAALQELKDALARAEELCGTAELDGVIQQVRDLEKDQQGYRQAAANGTLAPLPGETADSVAEQLGTAHRHVGTAMAQLLTAAAQGNESYTNTAAKDVANILRGLSEAIRGVAATTQDQSVRHRILDCGVDVMDKSANLLTEAKLAVNNQTSNERLAQVAKSVSVSLKSCVECLPSMQEVDKALRALSLISERLAAGQFPASGRSYQEVQSDLNNRAVHLNQAATDIVAASQKSPQQVSGATNRFSRAYEDFMDSGLEMAGVTQETETRTQIVGSLKSVHISSSKLMMNTKTYIIDPNGPNTKSQLTQAAR